jgi:3-phenylpropionate/cinnamic acid dioxygenase small subunit
MSETIGLLLVFPKLVINDIVALILRQFWPAAPDRMDVTASRTHRIVSKVRIAGKAKGEVRAGSSFVVLRFRNAQAAPYIGHYRYHLQRVDGRLKIRYRRAVLNMGSLHVHGAVSIIL